MKTALWIIGGIVVLLIVFGCGLLVGYRKALFSSEWGMNYYRNFYGQPQPGPFGQTLGRSPLGAHGVAGTVLAVTTSSIAVKDSQGNEESIAVGATTVIREMNDTIPLGDVKVGDEVTVIGQPDQQGQVRAQFIRVFSASSSMPMMPGTSFN